VAVPLHAALAVEVDGVVIDETKPALDFVSGPLTRVVVRPVGIDVEAPAADGGDAADQDESSQSPSSLVRSSSSTRTKVGVKGVVSVDLGRRRVVVFHVHAGAVDLRTKLRGKWLSKSLWEGLIEPFVAAHNKQSDAPPLDASSLIAEVDGVLVDHSLPLAAFVDPKGKASDVTNVNLTPSLSEHPYFAATETDFASKSEEELQEWHRVVEKALSNYEARLALSPTSSELGDLESKRSKAARVLAALAKARSSVAGFVQDQYHAERAEFAVELDGFQAKTSLGRRWQGKTLREALVDPFISWYAATNDDAHTSAQAPRSRHTQSG
jgi:hypothetical protein